MTSREERIGLLKGWLIAKDAPPEIMAAVDGLKFSTTAAADPLPMPEHEIPTVELTPRKARNWSPEQRTQAAERMRRMQSERAAKQRPPDLASAGE